MAKTPTDPNELLMQELARPTGPAVSKGGLWDSSASDALVNPKAVAAARPSAAAPADDFDVAARAHFAPGGVADSSASDRVAALGRQGAPFTDSFDEAVRSLNRGAPTQLTPEQATNIETGRAMTELGQRGSSPAPGGMGILTPSTGYGVGGTSSRGNQVHGSRSLRDPWRIAERANRRGDSRPLMALNRDEQQMGFDATMHAQNRQDNLDDFDRAARAQFAREAAVESRQQANQERGFAHDREMKEMTLEQAVAQDIARQQAKREEREAGQVVGYETVPSGDWDVVQAITQGGGRKYLNSRPTPKAEPTADEIMARVLGDAGKGFDSRYNTKTGFTTQVKKPAAAKTLGPKITTRDGPMIKDPLTGKDVPGPKIPIRVDPNTGRYRDLTPEDDAPGGDKAKPTSEAAGGDAPSWMGWLGDKK